MFVHSRRRFNAALAASGLLLLPRIGISAEILDDISRLNATEIDTLVPVTGYDSVRAALARAGRAKQKISIAGARHSQGGHIASTGGVTLDMRRFNRVLGVNPAAKTARVEPGATWADVQQAVNLHGLAVAVQQSSNIFTVGGSIAVNCHGRDPRHGCLIDTVRQMTIMLADGDIVTASRDENADLFAATVGGYGLTGVVLQAEIELEQDCWLDKKISAMSLDGYATRLASHAMPQAGPVSDIQLHFGRPSIRDRDLLERIILVDYVRVAEERVPQVPLQEERNISVNKAMMSLSRSGRSGKALRWYLQESFAEKPGSVTRISRNNAMRPEVRFLDYRSPYDSDILQEYFVPFGRMPDFVRELKTIARQHMNLLSVTFRTVRRDEATLLAYAREDMLAIVLYANVMRSAAGQRESIAWTRELVDAAMAMGGTYYLPYQRWPSQQQFARCYPRAQEFLDAKKKWDPQSRFSNRWSAEYLGV